jgi:hypothetical protein
MKHCPVCHERFDEDVIQFCTKDGTPLVEDSEPRFTAMPSDEDELGEDTVIRRRGDGASETTTERGERIVIPSTQPTQEQQVRTRAAGAYYAPSPPPQNTGKVVALTILGTLAAIGFGALLFWMLQKPTPTNINVNTNQPNINLNANGFDSNFNFNANVSMPTPAPININTNFNTNIKTPTPTPKPSASPTASPIPTETPERPTPTPRPTGTPRPSPTPTPRQGPRPPVNVNGN